MRPPRKGGYYRLNSRGEERILQDFNISKVPGVLKFVRCLGSSNVLSRGQILIFVKRHCTGVNLVEG